MGTVVLNDKKKHMKVVEKKSNQCIKVYVVRRQGENCIGGHYDKEKLV